MKEIISINGNGNLDFGDSTLAEKQKVQGFEFQGALYEVKTFADITKLEKNDVFLYESVPGTEVYEFVQSEKGIGFQVAGNGSTDITLGLEPEKNYNVLENGVNVGVLKTNIGGKLTLSMELSKENRTKVKITEN